jgi:curved DNA-binding protein CbpA
MTVASGCQAQQAPPPPPPRARQDAWQQAPPRPPPPPPPPRQPVPPPLPRQQSARTMNPYMVLQVNRDATGGEVKQAYRRLALRYHPDKHGGDERRFKQINAALQVLSDPELRGIYDQLGAQGVAEASEVRWRKASAGEYESPEEEGQSQEGGVAEERKGDEPRAAPQGLRSRLKAKLREVFGL